MARAWVWVVMLLLSACGASEQDGNGAPGVATPVAATGGGESTGTLLERAVAAMQAGRITRPVGDSALDLMVTLHGREPGNAGVQAALAELQPYVLLDGEHAIASGDIDDAERLVGALAMFNPDAVALPRLREGLEQARQRSSLAAGVEPDPAGSGAAAAMPAPRPFEAGASDAAVAGTSDGPVASASPTAVKSVARRSAGIAGAPAAPALPAPAVSRRGLPAAPGPTAHIPPKLVHDAAPEYPLSAMRRGLSGRVRLALTVRPDGGVADVSVVEASPAGVFEEAATAAARRWRFEPRDAPVDIERTLRFDLPRR